jgi:hypothetical protein
MKILSLLFLWIAVMTGGHAQSVADSSSYYVVTYTTGSAWNAEKSAQEQLYFKEHSAHLVKLRKEKIIVAGARYGEKGMIIIRAGTLPSAMTLIFSDVALKNNLFAAQIEALQVFYPGCLELLPSRE